MQGFRFVSPSQSSPSIQLSQRRACRLSPLVPTRSHNHLLRFSKACPRAGILLRGSASLWHRAHALLALCYIFANSLIWWLQARIVFVSTRSAPQFDRSPREGGTCATFFLPLQLPSEYSIIVPVLVLRNHPHLTSEVPRRLPRPLVFIADACSSV